MKPELRVGYVSDTHIDYYIRDSTDDVPAFIVSTLNPVGGDVLIVAGDISHYNEQTKKFLKTMTAFYNHILYTIGNHDLYLINKKEKKKYNRNSFLRIAELEEWTENEPNIYFLNGNSITIDGITFGGLPNWYDCPSQGDIQNWNKMMNDSNLIYEGHDHYTINLGYGYKEKVSTFNTQAFRKKQEEKFNNLENIDILVTHICPSIIPEDMKFQGAHASEDAAMFYMTDDFEKVKKTGAKYVIYGHDHTNGEWEQDGIKFLSNSIGYPAEWQGNNIKYFNIKGQ